jgi:hypothetical protein
MYTTVMYSGANSCFCTGMLFDDSIFLANTLHYDGGFKEASKVSCFLTAQQICGYQVRYRYGGGYLSHLVDTRNLDPQNTCPSLHFKYLNTIFYH